MIHRVRKGNSPVIIAGILLLLAIMAPVMADPVITIDNSSATAILDNLTNVDEGGTLILEPGIYREHGLTITKSITIRAAEGRIAADTIIDGMEGGSSILTITSGSAVTLDNLTLQNGTAVSGGAIYNEGTLSVTSGTFSNCTATQYGGAIFNDRGTITSITSSMFSNCTAFYGGAISNIGGTIASITSSTFTGCTATYNGGAIGNSGRITSITSTLFRNCSADVSGGAILNFGLLGSIASSTFSDCSAHYNGGAIYNPEDTIFSIADSAFIRCSASNGGAIRNGDGDEGNLTSITSSTFTGCSATSYGGAIYNDVYTKPMAIRFCRFYLNTAPDGPAIWNRGLGSVNAADNWWGSNNDPAPQIYGTVTRSPWLVLGATADPATINSAGSSSIRLNLTYDSDGGIHDPAGGHVPDGIPGSWAIVTGSGTVLPSAGMTTDGANTTRFRPSGTGATNISATVDGQTVYIGGDVSNPPATTTTTAIFATPAPVNDDGFPSATPIATQAETLPPVTVNIGGDSKAWQAVVTGTKLSDLIVTGTVQPGSGSNVTAPPGIVFQYISLVPARFTSITKAVIHFTVPQAWLDENHIAPGSIVLYRQTANGWEALPTTVLYTKDGTVYFSAESGGFSLFAIAGTASAASAAAPATIATTQKIISNVVPEQTKPRAVTTQAPVTTQTTTPPAAAPQPAAPSPLLNIVLIIAAIGILAGGGFMARRWWIRRQNPALFAEDE